jgi:hypothetical protein
MNWKELLSGRSVFLLFGDSREIIVSDTSHVTPDSMVGKDVSF